MLIKNPLHCNNIITAYENDEEIVVSRHNIGKYFKNIYILCPFTSILQNTINKDMLELEEYNNIISTMVLYKVKMNIIKNMIHYGNILYCNTDVIVRANHFGYNLDTMTLIIPFFNISFLNAKKYIDNINEENNLDSLYNLLVLNKYLCEDIKRTKNVLLISNIIKTLDESNYWKYNYNCMCNITNVFNKRRFNFNVIRASKDDMINNIINKLSTIKCNDNYLVEIFSSKKYTDPSSVICKNGYRLYNNVRNCKYSIDEINNLFECIEIGNLKELLFCNLLLSKEYCHLIINNAKLLINMKKFMNNYMELFEILIGYTWVRFYFEECINKYNIKTSDYYIFTAETASLLPTFHFNYATPHTNPYMPILVGLHALNPLYNIGGINISSHTLHLHRICNTHEFRQRMNIFICNNITRDIFEGLDFSKHKMAITGSIMTACMQFYHPLLELFDMNKLDIYDDTKMNNIYNRFFNEYYCTADIDVMIRTNDMVEFLDIGKSIHKCITNNIINMYKYAEEQHVKLHIHKQIYLFVTEDFIKNTILANSLNVDKEYNVIIENLLKPQTILLFETYAWKLHNIELTKLLGKYTDDEVQELLKRNPELNNFSVDNLIIKLYSPKLNSTMVHTKMESEYSNEEVDMILDTTLDNNVNVKYNIDITEGISISTSYKIRISAPQLDHDFEIFPIKKDDFMQSVAMFHMPCVRAYYDSMNVYMTPSFITAHMTFMNIDYKYFAGSKDPIDIINKYRMRGFGTWLNENEIKLYLKYTSMVPFWNNLLNIKLDMSKTELTNALGPLYITNTLFYPRQFNIDYYTDVKIKPIPLEEPYCNLSVAEPIVIQDYLKIKYNAYDLSKDLQLIKHGEYNYINSETGYILPLKLNIMDVISTILARTY